MNRAAWLSLFVAACAAPASAPSPKVIETPASAARVASSAMVSAPIPSSASAEPIAGASAPPARDEKLEACKAGLEPGMKAYWKKLDSQTSVASVRMILAVFGKTCKERFASWANAAELASHVGRDERSRILANATADVCPQAVKAKTAREIVAACPPTPFGGPDSRLWDELDAGTYSFALALTEAGLPKTLMEELMLQASFNHALDK